jgi:hypothetical protein
MEDDSYAQKLDLINEARGGSDADPAVGAGLEATKILAYVIALS